MPLVPFPVPLVVIYIRNRSSFFIRKGAAVVHGVLTINIGTSGTSIQHTVAKLECNMSLANTFDRRVAEAAVDSSFLGGCVVLLP